MSSEICELPNLEDFEFRKYLEPTKFFEIFHILKYKLFIISETDDLEDYDIDKIFNKLKEQNPIYYKNVEGAFINISETIANYRGKEKKYLFRFENYNFVISAKYEKIALSLLPFAILVHKDIKLDKFCTIVENLIKLYD